MIPIVINNRNRLTTTRNLADSIRKLGNYEVIILDNASTYPPLLDWYDTCTYEIVRETVNHGQLAIYNSGLINRWPIQSWVAYTDSDIELGSETPANFADRLCRIGDKYSINKVGLALRIDDIPDNDENQKWVKQWESRFWTHEVEPLVYTSELDTTFGVIKVGIPFQYHALRVGGNMTCRHLPWYKTFGELNEEEIYYLEHSSPVSTYKRNYNNYINAKKNIV